MALIVGETTYATTAEADTYNTARGMTDWVALDETIKEQYLTLALDKIEDKFYIGVRYLNSQELCFPRSQNLSWDTEGEIPKKVKEAQIEEAYSIFNSANDVTQQALEKGIKKQKINDTEVEFSEEIVKGNYKKNELSTVAKSKLRFYLKKSAYY